jgi:hypothetical protein
VEGNLPRLVLLPRLSDMMASRLRSQAGMGRPTRERRGGPIRIVLPIRPASARPGAGSGCRPTVIGNRWGEGNMEGGWSGSTLGLRLRLRLGWSVKASVVEYCGFGQSGRWGRQFGSPSRPQPFNRHRIRHPPASPIRPPIPYSIADPDRKCDPGSRVASECARPGVAGVCVYLGLPPTFLLQYFTCVDYW